MAWDILVKPQFDNGGGGIVTQKPGTYIVRGPDGQILDTINVSGERGHEGYKAQSGAIASGLPPGSSIEFEGKVYNMNGPGGARYEFSYGNSNPTLVGDKGAIGSAGGGGGFQPGQVGDFGVFPAYQGGNFPTPNLATFTPAKPAPYKYTDPFKFGEAFGDFNRMSIAKDFGLAKDIGMSELELELKGLQAFAPAAAALAREQISIDNQFNQAQRLQQVEGALPGARESLSAQTGRAETYARGRFTGDIEDRAFELGIRSSAADRAVAGGFGPTSSVARKASDLMSAEQRFQVAQYGEGLLSKSIGERANLLLAPTEYSTAGSQIKTMPSVDLGTRTAGALESISAKTLLSPAQALESEIQQQQFGTNLQQNLNIFNAQGGFDASKINAASQNQFALDKFGYDVGYATSVASGTQTDINTQQEINQQNEAKNTFDDNKEATQDQGSVGSAVGAGIAIVAGAGDIIDWVDSNIGPIFGSDSSSVEGGVDFGSSPEPFGKSLQKGAMQRPTTTATGAAPSAQTAPPNLRTFAQTAGLSLSGTSNIADLTKVVDELRKAGQVPLNAAGISNVKKRGDIRIGYDSSGRPMYSSPKLLKSNDFRSGDRMVKSVRATIQPFRSVTREDAARMDEIGRRASNPQFITTLDSHKGQNDFQSFAKEINNVLSVQKPGKKPKAPKLNSPVGGLLSAGVES